MARPFNFSAGPAVLPEPVLARAAAEMLDWHGSGMSVMEMSHRGREFGEIFAHAHDSFRRLMGVPANYKVLFMQGGGIGENAIVPLNLIGRTGKADFVVTGSWSAKSAKEASRYGNVQLVAPQAADRPGQPRYVGIPDPATWTVRPDAAYLHLCGNETIDGVEFFDWPQPAALGAPDVPLVVDVSSHILSRPLSFEGVGLMFGGAQKNIGPAGLTIVVVREDLLGHALPVCPSAFDYATVAANGSMYNTPPTYAIYIAGLVFDWIDAQGGVQALAERNAAKAALLYACLDASGFYRNAVAPACRSRMNVPFFLADERLNDAFLIGAKEAGLLQLKGHKSVGGMRASLYNAMPLDGVHALVSYLQDFERRHA
jgi:phosphoserine aminotransferase